MPLIINIQGVKVNSLANNASFDVGPCIHNSHSSNNKIWGSNVSVGDYSPAISKNNNNISDPDWSDQSEFFGADSAFTSQG